MTRVLLAIGLLLAGGLALGATTSWATAEGELPPCEWFLALAEDYPELEILECQGEWDDEPGWAGHGLLSWDGKTAEFEGAAGDWYDGEREYAFWWSVGEGWSEACKAVPALLNEERERRESWRHLPMYEGRECTVEGVAFTESESMPVSGPGVFWDVEGRLEELGYDRQVNYGATLYHDLSVVSVRVFEGDAYGNFSEGLVQWPGQKYRTLFPADGSSWACDAIEWVAENYREVEIVECQSFREWPKAAGDVTFRSSGLVAWDGRRVTGLIGGLGHGYEPPWFAWDEPEACESFQGWLQVHAPDYVADCDNRSPVVLEGMVTSEVLEFRLAGVLSGPAGSRAYYEARLNTAFAVEEATIWAMDGEPSLTYPPMPAEIIHGLALSGFFIPEVALSARQTCCYR